MEFILPDSVMNILSRLETDGFSAFVAGGAVRDTIMGKTPHDYDIATSARPEEVKKLFRRTIDTGIKHGTITVVHNKTGYEVTTFRTDGEYIIAFMVKSRLAQSSLASSTKHTLCGCLPSLYSPSVLNVVTS